MAKFLYTPNPANLGRFFSQMQTLGKPEKVTQKWLEGIGFKGKSDRFIIGVLKSLGFIDSSGVPTDRWMLYRNKKQAPVVMARSLRETYADLFQTYPDAYQKDDEVLKNFLALIQVLQRELSS